MSHQILIGSMEVEGQTVTAGVYTNDLSDLRYIRADLNEFESSATLGDVLSKVYDRSEGCLIQHNFKDNVR